MLIHALDGTRNKDRNWLVPSCLLLLALSALLVACAASPRPEPTTVAGAGPTGRTSPAAALEDPRPAQTVAAPTATSSPAAVASPQLNRIEPSPTPAPSPGAFDPSRVTLGLEPVVEGLMKPVALTHAGDRSGRLFVVEQRGTIRVIQDGTLLPQPFLNITSLVNSSGSEQGLLGLAFHPRYSENGLFFVNYTDRQGDTVVARYRVSSSPNQADPASARVILTQDQPFPNHNGGHLVFGPDGYLWIGLGDGGSANDPRGNGQNGATWLGKMLRIDVDRGDPYAVPPDNPFVGNAAFRPEIWAYGLRNPWRYSFDRATGDLSIADVGQNAWEEVNFQPAGARGGQNYGWNRMEGAHCRGGSTCDPSGLVLPVAEYGRSDGCSITGGYVYRGRTSPALVGAYLYGDYCSGRIWALARRADGAWTSTRLLQAPIQISSFGEDEAGELYLTSHGEGKVYRIVGEMRR